MMLSNPNRELQPVRSGGGAEITSYFLSSEPYPRRFREGPPAARSATSRKASYLRVKTLWLPSRIFKLHKALQPKTPVRLTSAIHPGKGKPGVLTMNLR